MREENGLGVNLAAHLPNDPCCHLIVEAAVITNNTKLSNPTGNRRQEWGGMAVFRGCRRIAPQLRTMSSRVGLIRCTMAKDAQVPHGPPNNRSSKSWSLLERFAGRRNWSGGGATYSSCKIAISATAESRAWATLTSIARDRYRFTFAGREELQNCM